MWHNRSDKKADRYHPLRRPPSAAHLRYLGEGKRHQRVVYTSDTPARVTNYARQVMWECDLLVVNTPTFESVHENHITVIEALELKERVGARQMILTHINNHENKPHGELEEFIR